MPIILPFTPFTKTAKGPEVNAYYKKLYNTQTLRGTKNDMIKSVNTTEEEDSYLLHLWKVKKDLKPNTNSSVDFEMGEYVLQDDIAGNKGKKYTVRDFEGKDAVIDELYMKMISDKAWNLRLSQSKLNKVPLFVTETEAKKKNNGTENYREK